MKMLSQAIRALHRKKIITTLILGLTAGFLVNNARARCYAHSNSIFSKFLSIIVIAFYAADRKA